MSSRRDFLKQAILLSGAAGFSSRLPRSIERAFSIDPEPGSSYLDAEHVVILMQENRSFDHAMGSLQGVRGFNDPRALRLANGNSVFLQASAAGETYAPWRFDIKDTRATWTGSVPHTRDSQVDAWNGGHHNNWIDAKRSEDPQYAAIPLTMGHYTREDIPFYYALADAFTVCDQHYCGVMSCTNPNRLTFMTGTVRNRQNAHSKVYLRNEEIAAGGLEWDTFPKRLAKAGISWKYYQNDLTESGGLTPEERDWLGNFGTNVLENFTGYNVRFTPRYQERIREKMAAQAAEIQKLRSEMAQHGDDPAAARKYQAWIAGHVAALDKLKAEYKHSEGSLSQLSAEDQGLNRNAFVTNDADTDFHRMETLSYQDGTATRQMKVPKGDILYQFREDVRSGKLPTVSWLSAPGKFSDHPSSPWYGAWYVSEVMDILTSNPEVWKKTIFILTYDENDGYFDHAPSYVAADPHRKITGGASAGIHTDLEYSYGTDELALGVAESEARSGPIGLGYRVPMVIASPWSRGGWVNSQLFEHTSTLQFLERFIGSKYNKQVRETNISAWRRAISGDLTSTFRQYDGKRPSLPFLNRDKYVESIQRARYKKIPSDYRALSAEQIASVNRDARTSGLIPAQEPGVRQACALPYEPYADGHLHHDGKKFELVIRAGNHLFGERSAGFPFNVYLYGTKETTAATAPAQSRPNMISASYAVNAGSGLKESVDLSGFASERYDIAVHGPNGFFREFTGDHRDPAIEVACRYETGALSNQPSGNIELLIAHKGGSQSYTVRITDHSYGAKPITKIIAAGKKEDKTILDLSQQHGWYDFSIQVAGANGFAKRYAGHVETGRPSSTDPVMGEA